MFATPSGQGDSNEPKEAAECISSAAKASSASFTVSALAKAGLSGFTSGSIAISRSMFAARAGGRRAPRPHFQSQAAPGVAGNRRHRYPGLAARAMDIKQQAVGVVDAVSAEDIGQFPDASIGEALARIPASR